MESSLNLPLMTIPYLQPFMIACCWPQHISSKMESPVAHFELFSHPLYWPPSPLSRSLGSLNLNSLNTLKKQKLIPFGLKSCCWIYSQISSWLKQAVFSPIICPEFRCAQAQPLAIHSGQRRALKLCYAIPSPSQLTPHCAPGSAALRCLNSWAGPYPLSGYQ